MKHLLIFISFVILLPQITLSQEHNIHPVNYIFDPNVDAKQNIGLAIQQAGREHKHLFLLIGGDWSFWSRNYSNQLYTAPIKKYMDEKYIIVRVNFSPSNKNEDVLNAYACPHDQGYPITIILDEKGNKIHTENSDQYKIQQKTYTGYNNEALFNMIKLWGGPAKEPAPTHNILYK